MEITLGLLVEGGRLRKGIYLLPSQYPVEVEEILFLKCVNPKHGSGNDGSVLLMHFTNLRNFCSVLLVLEWKSN